jgi:hypothetical protein
MSAVPEPKHPSRPAPPKRDFGTPFKEMTRERKLRFVAKLIVCLLTFGFVFPNIMSD